MKHYIYISWRIKDEIMHISRVIILIFIFLSHPLWAQENKQWFSKTTHVLPDGKLIDKVIINGPPEPPAGYIRPVWRPSGEGQTRGSLLLACVPAFDWSFGCSATSAAMMAGYYDIIGRSNMYAGSTNGSVMPLDNSSWPDTVINGETRSQCPLSATAEGLDGRTTKGHVDDYWISLDSPGPDPWVTGGWTEHTYGDCVGDYMFTNQWDASMDMNTDGGTTFWFYTNGAKLRWSDIPSSYHDGGAGLRDFMISRGFTVTDEYNQYIVEQGLSYGFSYANYKAQIDNGRPVLIHVEGHTMIGFGYDDDGNKVHLHDTWDYSDHWMTWAGSYSGMLHYAVTVIELSPVTYSDLTIRNTTVGSGKNIDFAATDTIFGSSASSSDYLTIQGECTMTAGSAICLKPGFHAQEGSEFQAIISATSSPGSNFNQETNSDAIEIPKLENTLQGVEDVTPLSLHLYPNQCNGKFIVMINGDLKELVLLVVADMVGNIIYQQEQFSEKLFQIDMSQHPRGIYVVRVIHKNGMFSEIVVY